jgi:hypothetical protein
MHFLLGWSETRRFFIVLSYQLCFRICYQEGPRKSGRNGNLIYGTHLLLVCADNVKIVDENINT